MLVKLTCRGRDFAAAVARARRALAEFRIRGVATNIPFLQAVLDDPDFAAGRRRPPPSSTSDPELLTARALRRPRHQAADLPGRRDRQQAQRRPAPRTSTRQRSCPRVDLEHAAAGRLPAAAARARARRASRARAASSRPRSPSPTPRSATPTSRCWPPGSAPATWSPSARPSPGCTPELLSRGGLGRCDLRRRPALPVRGSVGAAGRAARGPAQPLPADAAARPQHRRLHAVPAGGHRRLRQRGRGDRHRHLPHLRRAQRRRARCGRPSTRSGRPAPRSPRSRCATPATCPDPAEKLYTLDYYLRLAEQIVDAGAHVLAIKDMAGLLRAPAAAHLVTALRERFDLPVHLHTHDTAGGQLATLLAAVDAGVDAVDVASALDGRHHQPAAAVGAGRRHRRTPPRETGLDLQAVLQPGALLGGGAPRCTRRSSPACRAPTGRVYQPRDPRRPAVQPAPAGHRAGPGRAVRGVEDMYAAADRMLGQPGQGDPVVQGGRRPGAAPGRRRRRPGRLRGQPGTATTSRTRSSASSPASSATRPAAGPSRSAPRRCRAARSSRGRRELTDEDAAALARDPRPTLNRLLFPGPTKEFTAGPGAATATCPSCGTVEFLYGLAAGRRARGRPRAGRAR